MSTNSSWRADSVRATLFTSAPPELDVRQWWMSVAGTGEAPHDLVVQEGPKGHASAQAEVDDGKALLRLVCEPTRIDWHYILATRLGADGQLQLPTEAADSALAGFVARLENWLLDAPRCHRAAIGCVARIDVASKEEGYAALQAFLPAVRIDTKHSSDFGYQINRPRRSKAARQELLINRLSQWLAGTLVVQGQNSQAAPAPSAPSPAVSVLSCRVTLDINTASDNNRVLEADEVVPIVKELQELALEILTHGDVA